MSAAFKLDDKIVEPMQVARTASGNVIYRGEWPCIPFGGARAVQGLTERWRPCDDLLQLGVKNEGPQHGAATGLPWDVVDAGNVSGRITLRVHLPTGPIAALTRTITPNPLAPALDVTLEVEPREDALLSVGLHPTLRLPTQPGSARIVSCECEYKLTFPGHLEAQEPHDFSISPDTCFESLRAVPTTVSTDASSAKASMDLSKLPSSGRGENLIQLCGVRPDPSHDDGSTSVTLEDFEAGCATTVRWRVKDFPSCQLWLSNRGRSYKPWRGNHVALGVEPVCAAFDLGPTVGAGSNPIAASGVPTAMQFHAGKTWKTTYRIECTALGKAARL